MTLAPETSAPAAARLEASRPVGFLDDLRVPYAAGEPRAGLQRVGPAEGPWLMWPGAVDAPERWLRLERAGAEAVPVFAAVLDDAAAARTLMGDGWTPVRAIRDPAGVRVASVWQRGDGSLFVPFDPDAAVHALRSERYAVGAQAARGRASRVYYRVRPLLARRVQIALRRAFARVQARTPFPRWPAEPALHDLVEALAGMLATVTGGPLPALAPWPDGHRWALVLTHDVELSGGYEHVGAVAALERSRGLRSAFNFVPARYPVDDADLAALAADGFEIGVHGLHHDGRDLESLALLRERLPAMRDAARRWGADGFRAPATQRRHEWMPELGFGHDSSFPDSDPFEPQAGGCCSWLPFFNAGLVELPITLAQDHTLFVILGRRDPVEWTAKVELLRARGGMALIDTHPDYLVEPRVSAAYAALLDACAGSPGVWHALPREVAAWWRRRAASAPHWTGERWEVAGAADARLQRLEGRW